MSNAQDKRRKSTDRRNVWLLVLTTLLVLGSVFMFTPPQEKINQGLDIQGGLSVVLTAKSTDGGDVSAEDLEASREIIESRVNALGASEATVQVQGTNQILVQIPGLSDAEEALNTIGKTGVLEFARLDSFTDEDVVSQIESGSYGSSGYYTDELGNTLPSGTTENLTVESGTYTPIITGENITRVTVDRESETSTYYAVNIELDSEGTTAFAEASQDLVADNGQIVIILDGEVESAPAVQSAITDGRVAITGNYTQDEAQALKTVLESGSLPVSFEYSQSQIVGPTLGQDALQSGVVVAAIGLLVVMLYLLAFYRGLGFLTAVMMAVFAVFYLGVLATLSHFGLFSLSLAGLAGVVLTIGMAADASILVMERVREEVRMGRSIRAASITGVRHAIFTAIDANIVTLISAVTLFFLATSSVKGFGLTLAIGIVCNVLAMVIFMMPLIRLLAPRVVAKHPAFWDVEDCQALAAAEAEGHIDPAKVKGRFIKRDINFLGVRKVFLTIAAVCIALTVVIVGVRGLNFGIEFQGGTSITFHNTGDVTIDQVRDAFADAGETNATVQTTVTDGEEGFLVRTSTTDPDVANAAATQVAEEFGWTSDSYETSTIGPDWGAGVIQSSVIALLVSFALIIAYIALRFEYKMGITAVIAMLHDIIIVVGVYALFGREITPNAVAALLTILGYSLYDKVVVFHRINENMKTSEDPCTFMTMANHSINQVFLRSVNASVTTLIPVVAMLIFGGETLRDFAFAMTIGLVCGAYSTISVATPLYCIWKTREKQNARLVKKYGTEVERYYLGYHPKSKRLAQLLGTAEPQEAAVEDAAAVENAADTKQKSSERKATPKKAPSEPARYRRKKKDGSATSGSQDARTEEAVDEGEAVESMAEAWAKLHADDPDEAAKAKKVDAPPELEFSGYERPRRGQRGLYIPKQEAPAKDAADASQPADDAAGEEKVVEVVETAETVEVVEVAEAAPSAEAAPESQDLPADKSAESEEEKKAE